jgi:hypothetical protein
MAVDLSNIVALTNQISSLQQQVTVVTDPTVKALLQSQIAVATSQLNAEAIHTQAQVDASSNALNTLGLFTTLTQAVGAGAPAIISLFKP